MTKDILYQKVYNHIKDQIKNGSLKSGSLLNAERNLMSEYNVSRVTIRKALSHLVADGFIKARPSVGYEILPLGSNNKNDRLIGVILNNSDNPENFVMLQQIEKVFKEQQYSIALSFNNYDVVIENECIERLQLLGVKGFLISPATIGNTDNRLSELILKKTPVVLMGQPRDWKLNNAVKSQYYNVCEDNEKCVFQCLRHLESLGHENIGFVKPKDLKFVSLREQAYLKLRQNKFIKVVEVDTRLSIEDINVSLKPLFNSKKCPSAFIAYDNYTGLLTVQVVKRFGLRVPENISVISIGPINRESLLYFPLTNIEPATDEWAIKLLSMLEAQFNQLPINKISFVNYELAIRASTAKAPVKQNT